MRTHLLLVSAIGSLGICPALHAQNLKGTLVDAGTGAPVPGGSILAIQKTASASQKPLLYQTRSDTEGAFGLNVPTGQYTLCVKGPTLYLDPCQWNPGSTSVTISTTAVNVPLALTRGGRFLVRVHDKLQLLPQAEAIQGQAVTVVVTTAIGSSLPLTAVYDSGRIRDYDAVLPLNVTMSVAVMSAKLTLTDQNGAPLAGLGIPFQVLPLTTQPAATVPPALVRRFPPPDATIVHVYVAAIN